MLYEFEYALFAVPKQQQQQRNDNNHIRFAEAIAGVFDSANRPRSHQTKQDASSCAIGRVLEIMRIIVHVGRCTLNGKIAFACFYHGFPFQHIHPAPSQPHKSPSRARAH